MNTKIVGIDATHRTHTHKNNHACWKNPFLTKEIDNYLENIFIGMCSADSMVAQIRVKVECKRCILMRGIREKYLLDLKTMFLTCANKIHFQPAGPHARRTHFTLD